MPAITEQQHKTPLNTTKQMTSVTGEKFTLKSSMFLKRFLLLFLCPKKQCKESTYVLQKMAQNLMVGGWVF